MNSVSASGLGGASTSRSPSFAGPRTIPLILASILLPVAARAQDADQDIEFRIAAGIQAVPSYPGADRLRIQPLGNVTRSADDGMLDVKAPEGAIAPSILRLGALTVGPSIAFQGARSSADTDGRLARVGSTVELGGFATYRLAPFLWVSGDVRRGVNGHEGWIGTLGADVVGPRKGTLLTLGPRFTFSDARFQRAYFGVTDTEAAFDLAAFRPGGGLQAVGANAGYTKHIVGPWGVYAYVRYDRLVDDAGQSPVVRAFGARDQTSGGLALSYTFGRRNR